VALLSVIHQKKILPLLQCMPLGIDYKHIFLWQWVFLVFLNVSFRSIVCAEIPTMKEAGLRRNY